MDGETSDGMQESQAQQEAQTGGQESGHQQASQGRPQLFEAMGKYVKGDGNSISSTWH